MTYSTEEMLAIADSATPWPEIDRLAHEIDDADLSDADWRAQVDELGERIVRERPYLNPTDAFMLICLAVKSPDDRSTAPL